MLHYTLYQDVRKESATKGKWYARVTADETVGITELAAHMASHTSTFSKGEIVGLITDMVTCVHELCLDGKQVKIPDLALFSLGITTSPATTREDFVPQKNIKAVRLRARGTGDMRVRELMDKAHLAEQRGYDDGKQPAASPATQG